MNITKDYHSHSITSADGSYNARELVDMAFANGLNTFSITDHNSVGSVQEAINYVKENDIPMQIIPGIEIDCDIDGVGLHVLGYQINIDDERFHLLSKSVHQMEYEAGIEMVKKIESYFNIDIDEEKLIELSNHNIITGEVIGEYLLSQNKYDSIEKLNEFKPGGIHSENPYVEFYWELCSQGKPGYVEMNFMSLKDCIELIHSSGGVAVLAHPGKNVKENLHLLDKILKSGINGIEAYSSYHTSKQVEFYVDYAKNNELFITSGSDFHGKTKPSISIGEFSFDIAEELIHSF